MPKDVKFEHLSSQEIASAWNLFKQGNIPVILGYLFDKHIDEHRKRFDTLEEADFKAHRAALEKMKDMRGILQLEKPPKPIQ
jgi:hypothetical protein